MEVTAKIDFKRVPHSRDWEDKGKEEEFGS